MYSSPHSLKHDLKHQVTNNIGNVLKELGQLLRAESPNYNTLLVLQSRFQRLQQEAMEGRAYERTEKGEA